MVWRPSSWRTKPATFRHRGKVGAGSIEAEIAVTPDLRESGKIGLQCAIRIESDDGSDLSATDADLPADTLTFSLDTASQTLGMSIDATTGAFSWTPGETDPPRANRLRRCRRPPKQVSAILEVETVDTDLQ